MFRRSSARCQPGLNCRCPSTPARGARRAAPPAAPAPAPSRRPRRMMPTRSFIICCSSWWSVYGFSGGPPSAGVATALNGRSASAAAASICASSTRRPAVGRAPAAYSRRVQPGPPAEDQQVGQGVAAEPVGAVHAARHLAGREQARHPDGRRGVRVDVDAAHHVVAGRADLHRLRGDVDVRQLLELVVHRRQPPGDLLGRHPGGHVQEDPAVRGAAARPSPRS